VPASIAADWLTSTWDQNAGLYVAGPSASVVEEVAGAWLIRAARTSKRCVVRVRHRRANRDLHCPRRRAHHVLRNVGWDVERDGLTGAPRIRVVVGEKRHGTIDRALRMLGLGSPTDVVAADDNAGCLPVSSRSPGSRRSSARRPAKSVPAPSTRRSDRRRARRRGERVAPRRRRVGLWRASPIRYVTSCRTSPRRLVVVDAHKWLNVPYDNGIAFTAHPESHSSAFSAKAPYLVFDAETRDELDWTPEHSRRARGFTVVCGNPRARPLGDQRNDRAPAVRTRAGSRRAHPSRRRGAERPLS